MRSVSVIEDLRSRIARIEGGERPQRRLAFGVAAIDERLPGGGLLTGVLHEVAGSPDLCDDAAATVFLAGILARLDGPVFWCLRWRDLFAPSLGLAGLHPDRVIHVEAGSDTNVLLAMEECLRHGGLAAVVGEVAKVSTTATKRLQLAAEGSGVTALLFRRGERAEAGGDGSAAITRWRVRAAPSRPLGLPSLDRARWHLDLERARGGEAHHWTVEACDAKGRLALPADLVDRPAAQGEYQIAV
jgi:protein ImuA